MKQSEAGGVARHTAIYFVGSLLNRSASFVLLPLYLHVLTPTEFGWLSVVLASVEVLALMLGLGIGAAIARLLVECETKAQIGRVIGSALTLFLAPSVIVLALAFPSGRLAASVVTTAGISPGLFALGFATAVFAVFFEITLSVFRGLKQSWWYTAMSTGKSVLFLSLNTLFLLGFGWDVTGILMGTLLSVGALAGAAALRFALQYQLSISRTTIRRLAKIGLPIVPGAILDVIFSAMDKFYLAALVDPATVGVYALAARFAHLARIGVAAPFAQIWTIRRLEVETEGGDARDAPVFANILLGFLMIFLLASLALSLFSPEVISIIGRDDYVVASEYVPYMLAGLFLYTLKWNFEIGIFAAEKTIWISVASLIVVLVAIPAYGLIIPAYGAKGAAIAFVLLGVLRTALTMVLAGRFSSMVRTFPSLETALLCAVVVAAFAGARLIGGQFQPFENIGIRFLVFAISVVVMAAMFGFRSDLAHDLIGSIKRRGRS